MNKLLTFLIILMVAAGTVAVVSAANTEKINGLEFNIPDGYEYDANHSQSLAESVNISPDQIAGYSNGTNIFAIMVMKNPDNRTLDDINTGNFPIKTINGKQGILNDRDDYIGFAYLDGDKIVSIITLNQSVIDQIIIK